MNPGGDVRAALFDAPWCYSFFQAVRILHRMDRQRSPLGRFVDPREEVVRLRVPSAIAFPPSEVQSLQAAGSAAPEMVVSAFGLIGPQGVMPYWYSVTVEEATRSHNHAPRAFLDIFQHRALSHLYRAWEKSRPEVSFERGGADTLEPTIRAIVGLGSPGLEQRLDVSDTIPMFYAGLLGPVQRSAIGLEQLLQDYFGVPVEVQQFAGGWFELSDESLCRLGDDGNLSSQLGVGAVVGTAIWNEQARVRIRVGPVGLEDFTRFLPNGQACDELRQVVTFYSEEPVEFELQLVLRRDQVTGTVLGSASSLPLGWGSWVCTRPVSNDMDQVVFSL